MAFPAKQTNSADRTRRRRFRPVLGLGVVLVALAIAVPAAAFVRKGGSSWVPSSTGSRRHRHSTTTTTSTTVAGSTTTVPGSTTTVPGSTTTSSSTTTSTTYPSSTTSTTYPSSTTTSTTVPSTSTTVPASPCGAAIAKASGGYWQCSFDDEFDGTTLDTSKWIVQQTATSGFHSGPECFVDSPNNISLANGVLTLTARQEAAPFTCPSPLGNYTTQYTSGMVSTWGLFAQAYGRFEVRAKVPPAAVKGLQESFWLWPQNMTYGAWPASGEIDIAEIYSLYNDRAVPYIHYNSAAPDPNVTNTNCMINDVSQFHTYAVDWTPSSITIIYDGHTCLTDTWDPAAPLTHPQPFDQPFIICLTQALGIGGNAFDPATTPLPATTQIDYVRAWK